MVAQVINGRGGQDQVGTSASQRLDNATTGRVVVEDRQVAELQAEKVGPNESGRRESFVSSNCRDDFGAKLGAPAISWGHRGDRDMMPRLDQQGERARALEFDIIGVSMDRQNAGGVGHLENPPSLFRIEDNGCRMPSWSTALAVSKQVCAGLRLSVVALALALSACGPGTSQSRGPTEFPALTKGSPEALESTLEGLKYRYEHTIANDPQVARENFEAYTKAVIATATPLWNDTSAPPSMRARAAKILLEVWHDRLDMDDQAFDQLLEWTDRIAKEAPENDDLRATAAYYRFISVDEAPEAQLNDPVRKQQLLRDAALRLGHIEGTLEAEPGILKRMADEALVEGDEEVALEFYGILSTTNPASELAMQSAGIARRLGLRGKVITDIEGRLLNGGKLDVESLRGKVVLLMFWGTFWQDVSTLPLDPIRSLRTQYGDQLAVVGVLYDESIAKARGFVEVHEIDWPQIVDGLEMVPPSTSPLALTYGISTSPYFMVLDREGRLSATGMAFEEIEPTLKSLLGSAPGSESNTDSTPVEKPKSSSTASDSSQGSAAAEDQQESERDCLVPAGMAGERVDRSGEGETPPW